MAKKDSVSNGKKKDPNDLKLFVGNLVKSIEKSGDPENVFFNLSCSYCSLNKQGANFFCNGDKTRCRETMERFANSDE